MALWFDLKVNNDTIGQMQIIRETPLEASNPGDCIYDYVVIVDGRRIGQVEHRYGDGAWMLLRKALELTVSTP